MTDEFVIRPYLPGDRASVRRIAYETSFFGHPELFLEDREIIAEVLTSYFTDFEPESSFVAVKGTEVLGYLTGTKHLRRVYASKQQKFFWGLAGTILRSGVFLKKGAWQLLFHYGLSICNGEFMVPNYSRDYPAFFHINCDRIARGKGVGSRLVGAFENYLAEHDIHGVRVGTMSESAKRFFIRNGYEALFTVPRSCWAFRLGKRSFFYVLGKKF